MENNKLIDALLSVGVETGSLACLGCGYEHNCGIHGCAIIRQAATQLAAAVEDITVCCETCAKDILDDHCYVCGGGQQCEKWVWRGQHIATLNQSALDTDNKALTVEGLREMDGEPVWIVAHPDWGHWELSECAEDYFEDRDEDFYGMIMPPTLPDPMGRYGLHMLGWLAYRRPPVKE